MPIFQIRKAGAAKVEEFVPGNTASKGWSQDLAREWTASKGWSQDLAREWTFQSPQSVSNCLSLSLTSQRLDGNGISQTDAYISI